MVCLEGAQQAKGNAHFLILTNICVQRRRCLNITTTWRMQYSRLTFLHFVCNKAMTSEIYYNRQLGDVCWQEVDEQNCFGWQFGMTELEKIY